MISVAQPDVMNHVAQTKKSLSNAGIFPDLKSYAGAIVRPLNYKLDRKNFKQLIVPANLEAVTKIFLHRYLRFIRDFRNAVTLKGPFTLAA